MKISITKPAVTALGLTFAAGTPLYADTLTHFGDGVGSDVPALLDAVGIGSGNSGSETTAESFIVPGVSGDTDLTFTFERDTGSFLFEFGVYDTSATSGINPVSDKEAFATAAVAASTPIFADSTDNPGATTLVSFPAGTQLGFFIIPNNTIAAFNADPGAFYPPATSPSSLRAPHFSISDANPGEFDQMLSFVANGVTLFTFEDLTRIGATDADFTDLAFTIDAELEPVEPPTGVPSGGPGLALTGSVLSGLFLLARSQGRRRRRN